jgi:acyl-CoA synthetase (NDP forming)
VKAVVIFSAGFAELGDDGRLAQMALGDISRSTGMRIIGPNCLGVYNAQHGFFGTFTSTFEAGRPRTGRVGVVSQSGAYGAHLSLIATMRGIGIRFWVTTGNECDVDVAETIGWFANHPDVSVIVAYAEGIRDRDRLFASLALAHERGKPVIFQKVGRTEIGAAAVRSHTASLAGSDAVYAGVFRQFGVYRATSTEEMLDIAYAASFGTFPASRRVGLMSISGGVGVQMADEAVQRGLDVTPMSDAAQTRLKAVLPFASPRNPVDITAHAFNDPGLVGTNLDVMLAEGTYDSIIAFFTYVAAAQGMVGPISESLRAAKAAYPQCLLVLSIVGPREVVGRYEEAGCPVFEDPTRAVRAVDALSGFSEAFGRTLSDMATPEQPASRLPPAPISEGVAKALFSDAGVSTVDERVCATAPEAVAAATTLGYPVALKVASPEIPHKTDIGGVMLGLDSADEVTDAFAAITRRARVACPDARLDGVLVSGMVSGGVETIMGVQQDPTFGPVVMFGLGGIFVEVLKDVAFRVAPFDEQEAHRMMRELRGFPVLEGVRGRPRGDLDATAAALAALSRFAATHRDSLQSAELNPVLVLPEGQGLVALDALIVPKA